MLSPFEATSQALTRVHLHGLHPFFSQFLSWKSQLVPLSFFSMDNAGNNSNPRRPTFKLDTESDVQPDDQPASQPDGQPDGQPARRTGPFSISRHVSLDRFEDINLQDVEALKDHPPEEDTEDERELRRFARYVTIFQWWRDEWFYTIVCTVFAAGLTVLLVKYDGEVVPDLIGGLQLDTFIIAMTTVVRVSMKGIVESSLSQAAWVWVSKARQKRCKHRARLQDFKLFDEASRGL